MTAYRESQNVRSLFTRAYRAYGERSDNVEADLREYDRSGKEPRYVQLFKSTREQATSRPFHQFSMQ